MSDAFKANWIMLKGRKRNKKKKIQKESQHEEQLPSSLSESGYDSGSASLLGPQRSHPSVASSGGYARVMAHTSIALSPKRAAIYRNTMKSFDQKG